VALIEIERNPPPEELRKFGLLWFPLFCAILGTVLWRKTGILPIGITLWCMAAPAIVLGALKPPWVRPIYLGLTYLTFPIGFVISHVMMALIYFGVMTPIGLMMRLAGKDPLRAKRTGDETSWWIERPEDDGEADKYFRQF
jgi:hypothetical protein